ncbi:MLO-like protein 1 isoform X3 [Tasmannia lanceolata]|uniref:MLO-like protein 1 isoform X3 n=1 Tax=Tasmannia lanceolata TaxID=3420 RepID=UPI0040641C8E
MGGGEATLEDTPTWVVAALCSVIVAISLAVERLIYFLGKYLKKKDKKPLLEALEKVKEELMLLGFISLLLSILQNPIADICIQEHLIRHMLPCKKETKEAQTIHFRTFSGGIPGSGRRLFAGGPPKSHCGRRSFFKQFYPSLNKTDYITLRWGFIMTHCKANPRFNFHKYMVRALEADFKKVVGISWQLWIFVIIFLFLNVDGRRIYFWIAFIPLILLLAVGAKLEHVIIQLAYEVRKKHTAVEGNLVVQPSDNHFWFHRPRIILYLIHFILFQNAFEIAFFLWIVFIYGFDSCIMGHFYYIITRLTIGVFIQIFCSYSTLPLYAIVTQMGSSFSKAIFEKDVQKGLNQWVERGKKKKGFKDASFLSLPCVVKNEMVSKATTNSQDGLNQVGSADGSSIEIQWQNAGQKESMMEEGTAEHIDSIAALKCPKPEGS